MNITEQLRNRQSVARIQAAGIQTVDTSQLQNIEVDGVDMSDYPRFCDAFISYAEHRNGVELTEDEYESLDPDWVYDRVCSEVIEGWSV